MFECFSDSRLEPSPLVQQSACFHPGGSHDGKWPDWRLSGAAESLLVSNCWPASTRWRGIWVGQAWGCLSSGRLGGLRSADIGLGSRYTYFSVLR